MVNDDKPFLQITPEGVTAWGSPWMGKHGLGANIQVPLKAICILDRGEDNRIRPISSQEALPMLFQQSQRPADRENLLKYMDLIDQLADRCAFYRMACNMDPQAAATILYDNEITNAENPIQMRENYAREYIEKFGTAENASGELFADILTEESMLQAHIIQALDLFISKKFEKTNKKHGNII
jgi:hypothetical protein